VLNNTSPEELRCSLPPELLPTPISDSLLQRRASTDGLHNAPRYFPTSSSVPRRYSTGTSGRPPIYWGKRCGHNNTSNLAEVMNKRILEERRLSVPDFVRSMLVKMYGSPVSMATGNPEVSRQSGAVLTKYIFLQAVCYRGLWNNSLVRQSSLCANADHACNWCQVGGGLGRGCGRTGRRLCPYSFSPYTYTSNLSLLNSVPRAGMKQTIVEHPATPLLAPQPPATLLFFSLGNLFLFILFLFNRGVGTLYFWWVLCTRYLYSLGGSACTTNIEIWAPLKLPR